MNKRYKKRQANQVKFIHADEVDDPVFDRLPFAKSINKNYLIDDVLDNLPPPIEPESNEQL